MQIAILGTGYVGLVSGACFAQLGWNVTCIDKDLHKISQLNNKIIPFYEPDLSEIVGRNIDQGRLKFSYKAYDIIPHSDIIFIAVGTPTDDETGETDLSFVENSVLEIAPLLKAGAILVTKSTVPVGTGDWIKQKINETGTENFHIVSNPEFLREGHAVDDFMRPNRVIVGAESEEAHRKIREIYEPLLALNGGQTNYLAVRIRSAEMIKYAANSFLAMKITFINQIADLCEVSGANIDDIIEGIGLDKRIGKDHLRPGPGYGGSCFPKDTASFVTYARLKESPLTLIEATIAGNNKHLDHMVSKIIKAVGGDIRGKNVGVLGLTFKADTDDMRASPSLTIVPALIKHGAKVKAYDPHGMKEAELLLPMNVEYCNDAYATAISADVLVIITEWNEFKDIDLTRLASIMKHRCIVDLRNILSPQKLAQHGFEYYSVGR